MLQLLLLCFIFFSGAYLFTNSVGYKYIGLILIFLGFFISFHILCNAFPFHWISKLSLLIDLCCTFTASYLVVVILFILRDSKIKTDYSLDYIIVHGAKVYGVTPSPSLLERLEATLLYLESHHHTIAVLSGTKWPFSDLSEAQCMYNWLTDHGISEDRLLIEDQAGNTLENLRFSFERIKYIHSDEPPTIGLLTSDYHMHRALYIAKAESIHSVGIAVPTKRFLVRLNYFIREAFAMTEIYLFGVEGL